MKTNVIKHPDHARFLPIYEWQIIKYSYAGAVVIAYLDFVGRLGVGGDYKGVAQAKIVGEVYRYAGRDAVNRAIKLLTEKGLIKKFTPPYGGVGEYCLDIIAINNDIDSMSRAEIRAEARTELKAEANNVYVKEDVIENNKNKEVCSKSTPANCWQERDSGIVTWNQADIDRACKIEQKYDEQEIKDAAIQLTKENKEALPSFVERYLSVSHRVNAAIRAADLITIENAAKTEAKNKAIAGRSEENARVLDILTKLDLDEIDDIAESVINKMPVNTSWQTNNKIRMTLLGREVLEDYGREELLNILLDSKSISGNVGTK